MKIRFQIPSSRNYYCEIIKTKSVYRMSFFHVGEKIKELTFTESQLDREFFRKMAINVGIDFYALTGPYDFADEILRHWHKHFKKKGLLERMFKR